MDNMKYYSRAYMGKWLFAVLLWASAASCEDYLETSAPIIPEKGDVQVELSFGFADEDDGYTLSGKADTRSGKVSQNGGFCAELVPNAMTRGTGETTTPDLKPDALYGLYVLQYEKTSGTLLKSNDLSSTTPGIGTKLNCTLTPSEDCQLVIIARGKGNTTPAISGNLSAIQKLTMASTLFSGTSAIPTSGATQEEINKMPYVLYLPHVKVTSDGKLQSLEGAHDARLLLKRLATKLTVNWNVSQKVTGQGYALKEVKLCQVPADFRLLPTEESTEWGTTYPSSVSEFVDTYRLTTEAELNAGTKTVWIPANVRGTSIKATSPYYRTKENAPTAASYVELVIDNSIKKERLYYRAYLGGEASTDFNLRENTDYNWTLNVTSVDYRNDGRIQLLDQTPVKSVNLVETSNCFMMQPGTNISFNPYKHEAGGTDGWNTELVSGGNIITNKTISHVKVLWQTKDAGTSGDLVMGYVIDDGDHKNLVNTTDIGDKDNARVHVKVPVTNGGNAVIAAYNSSDKIVWSWHIWISDYIPKGLEGEIDADTRDFAIENARASTYEGTVHTYGGRSWIEPTGAFYNCVIMDRNLGATRAGIQTNLINAVRTFGLLYQGRRKDPFFSTADGTKSEVNTIYDGTGKTIEGGISKDKDTSCSLDNTIQNPLTFYTKFNTSTYTASWGGDGAKTIHDPCPKGWRVPSNTDVNNAYTSFIAGFGGTPDDTYGGDPFKSSYATNLMYYNGKEFIELKYDNRTKISSEIVGSGYMYFSDEKENPGSYTNKSAYFPGVSLREENDGKYRESASNNTVYLWSSTPDGTKQAHAQMQCLSNYQPNGNGIVSTKTNTRVFGFSVRCIQDRIKKGTKP